MDSAPRNGGSSLGLKVAGWVALGAFAVALAGRFFIESSRIAEAEGSLKSALLVSTVVTVVCTSIIIALGMQLYGLPGRRLKAQVAAMFPEKFVEIAFVNRATRSALENLNVDASVLRRTRFVALVGDSMGAELWSSGGGELRKVLAVSGHLQRGEFVVVGGTAVQLEVTHEATGTVIPLQMVRYLAVGFTSWDEKEYSRFTKSREESQGRG